MSQVIPNSDDLKNFANAFVDKLSWEMLKEVLDSHGITRSNSRQRTVDKIIMALESGSKESIEAFNSLWCIYQDVVIFGDKAVRFYKVGERTIFELSNFILNYQIPKSVFRDNFPLPQDQETLADYYKSNEMKPVPVWKEEFTDGSLLLAFASSRFFIEQEKLDKEWLEIANIKELSKFDEVVAKQNVYREACDFILVRPSEGIVEVGIDHPDTSGVFSQSVIHKDKAFNALLKTLFEETTLTEGMESINLTNPVVLFDAIRSFFEGSEGRIFRVRFLTADGLDDHPNMTNHKKDNYREARFYKGGRAEVDAVDPYRISIVWDRTEGNLVRNPFVNLLGKKSMLFKDKGRLNEALFSNTIGVSDYRFAVNKLFSKLPSI